MLKGALHHIEINVSNLKQSISFWDWFLTDLGYSQYQKWDSGQSYKLGETYLVFVQTEARFLDAAYHRSQIGLNHLAFHGESREHVDEITRKLLNRRINVLYQDDHPFAGGEGHYAVYFEDPDRIKVELVAPRLE
ncbi:VOC family protein [Saliterribacillus persicus]|uniref:Catechol 2,3-dioxygenase-like lactoylglutathione lyase family enzyme n=1 Tax=Saliterribacillus persicus TaxID=930114 RepID=A0A368X3H3_9BACI|nr:VOC family protein [Saliterribacillus persicus]RCW62571.1 catechol 2,3-dioxygenase-like lactoylglutathione lyase family enzyme [Saliterribacillus persicus]